MPLWLPFASILALLVFNLITTWWALVATLAVLIGVCLLDWREVFRGLRERGKD
jgi:hypothetical protein